MNHEEMERAIEFLLEHHAKFSTDIDRLTAEIQQLKELQAQEPPPMYNALAGQHRTDSKYRRKRIGGKRARVLIILGRKCVTASIN